MNHTCIIDKLRAAAERWRQLAADASDPEVAKELLKMAQEIDAALPFITEQFRRLD